MATQCYIQCVSHGYQPLQQQISSDLYLGIIEVKCWRDSFPKFGWMMVDGVGRGAFSGDLTSQNRWGGRKRNSLKQQTPLKIGGGQTKRTVHFPAHWFSLAILVFSREFFFDSREKTEKGLFVYHEFCQKASGECGMSRRGRDRISGDHWVK